MFDPRKPSECTTLAASGVDHACNQQRKQAQTWRLSCGLRCLQPVGSKAKPTLAAASSIKAALSSSHKMENRDRLHPKELLRRCRHKPTSSPHSTTVSQHGSENENAFHTTCSLQPQSPNAAPSHSPWVRLGMNICALALGSEWQGPQDSVT